MRWSNFSEVKQKRHLVTRMTTPLGHRTDTVYDKYGNVKSGKVSHRNLHTPCCL